MNCPPHRSHIFHSNLSRNFEETKEISMDFRRPCTQHALLTVNGAVVEMVSALLNHKHDITGPESQPAPLSPPRVEKSQSCSPHPMHHLHRHHGHLSSVMIISVSVPSLQDIYGSCLTRKAFCIAPTQRQHSAAIRKETIDPLLPLNPDPPSTLRKCTSII